MSIVTGVREILQDLGLYRPFRSWLVTTLTRVCVVLGFWVALSALIGLIVGMWTGVDLSWHLFERCASRVSPAVVLFAAFVARHRRRQR